MLFLIRLLSFLILLVPPISGTEPGDPSVVPIAMYFGYVGGANPGNVRPPPPSSANTPQTFELGNINEVHKIENRSIIEDNYSDNSTNLIGSNGNDTEVSEVIVVSHQNYSSTEEYLGTDNNTTEANTNPDEPDQHDWKAWQCTHTYQDFVDTFRMVLKKSQTKCHLHNVTANDISSRVRRRRDVNNRASMSPAPIAAPTPDIFDTTELFPELVDHHEVVSQDPTGFKKLRGCRWENDTHECHQYILFTIQEPECMLRSNVKVLEAEGEEDSQEVGEDVLELEKERPSMEKVWIYGFVCCTAEIAFARLGVILLPLLRKDLYEKFIIAMVGLAAGTLSGSSIFHLLPKAFSLEENPHRNQKYLIRCLVIAVGLWTFLMIERILKIFFHYNERKINKKRRTQVTNHLASHKDRSKSKISVISARNLNEPRRKFSDDSEYELGADTFGITLVQSKDGSPTLSETDTIPPSSPPKKFQMESNELPEPHPIKFQEGSLALVSSQAWMIIVGDSFLDFVDGLAIGTAFHDSILTGFSISLGILLEEFPHELGEFAVLLNAGLPFRKAFIFKLLSSCSTYIGLCVGVWLGGVEASHYVFALAAGMFLYIALVDMVPELNEVALKSSRTSVFKGIRVLMLQNVGLLVGMGLIYVMALYEDVFKRLG